MTHSNDDEDSHKVENTQVTDTGTISIVFALAAGFFAGVVWVGSKIADEQVGRESQVNDRGGVFPNIGPNLVHELVAKKVYVGVNVIPGRVEEFIVATRTNRDKSRSEEGCLKYDIYRADYDSTKFVLYEIWELPEGEKEHKKTEHYLKWRLDVEPMMATKRERLSEMPPGYTSIS